MRFVNKMGLATVAVALVATPAVVGATQASAHSQTTSQCQHYDYDPAGQWRHDFVRHYDYGGYPSITHYTEINHINQSDSRYTHFVKTSMCG